MEPIIFGDRSFSISHLAPGAIICACPEIGRDLTIGVIFTNHCYTEKFDPLVHDAEQIILHGLGGLPRVFCPIRHGLSVRLPAIVAELPSQKVYQTPQQRNYVYEANIDLDGQVYEIYFMLQRSGVAGTDLRMTVESAYPVAAPTPRPKRPNAIRFKILAHKTLRGERVRFAPR